MASNLYEILELDRNASPEDVRKAYKRQALRTHPDRQPQGITEEQKKEAEEQFRKVNNAYEVLVDPKNREIYDRVGVWPPPEEPVFSTARPSRSRTYPQSDPFNLFMSDPFFPSPFSDARRSTRAQPSSAHAYTSFAFTDPNVLFDSLFGDINHQFMNDPFFDEPPLFANFGNPQTNFGGASPNPFAGTSFANGTSMHPIFNAGPASFEEAIAQFHGGNMGGGFPSRMFSNPGTSGFGQAWSKSTMTSSINGRTETVVTERDPNGNERVTYIAPDGTERHTINGIEQAPRTSQGYLPATQSSRHSRDSRDRRVVPEQTVQISHEKYDAGPSSSHHSHHSHELYDQHPSHRTSHSSHNHRHDSVPVIPREVPRDSGHYYKPRRSETDRTWPEEDSRRRAHTHAHRPPEGGPYGTYPYNSGQESSSEHRRRRKGTW